MISTFSASINTWADEGFADLAAGLFEVAGVVSWDPEDGTCRVLVADVVHGLNGGLRAFSDFRVHDSGPLEGILVGV